MAARGHGTRPRLSFRSTVMNTQGSDDKHQLDMKMASAREAHELRLAHYQAQQAMELASHQAQRAQDISNQKAEQELFRSVLQTAQSALKVLVLINGAAAVAMLSLIGNLVSKGTVQTAAPSVLSRSLQWFAAGVFFGALATGVAYLTQCRYQREFSENKTGSGKCLRVITIVVAAVSLICFLVGACWVSVMLTN